MLEPGHLAHQRLGPTHFGTPTSAGVQMYQPLSAPPQTHGQHSVVSRKRSRGDSVSAAPTGLPELGPQDLGGMHSMGASYAQVTQAGLSQPHPTHHHHRLPDVDPPSKMLRRDEGAGAPSVVGQDGMPAPALRPRGPKLKFTTEDDQLLIQLKEQKNLTWKQIADFFPGRSSGTLQVRYCTKLKAKTTQWTDETDEKLRNALRDYENERWRIVSSKLGTGFTPIACQERAVELSFWVPPTAEFEATSPPSPRLQISAASTEGNIYARHD